MRTSIIIALLSAFSINLFGDGIIVPSKTEYPSSCLKNKVSDIFVDINGLIAVTTVYQEFENEWNEFVDGVYLFPLPPDARAIRLQYSMGDTLYDAVLKVQQQSTTPGTGEGGIIAEINKYMGINSIRLGLKNIHPQEIKAVKLTYISLLKQYSGTYEYNYPLNTGDFVKYPLDYLRYRIKVHSSKSIMNYNVISHPDFITRAAENNFLELEYTKSKAYIASDISFSYTVENSPFILDLYSWMPDTSDGYFTLAGKPQIESADTSLPLRLIFLLGNSTTMIGNKLNQSKKAISLALDELTEADSFNIVTFNSGVSGWKPAILPASQANISDAKNFLQGIGTSSGNRLDMGLTYSLNQLKNGNTLSSILAFTDGRSPLDPIEIEAYNTNKTCISIVAIGNEIDRVKMDAVAARNYGFVTYINESNILANEMVNIFLKMKSPILKEINYVFNDPVVYSVFPAKIPPIFAGTDFMLTGRYKIPGTAFITLEGTDYFGNNNLIFQKNFSSNNEISRLIWAKLAIDDLESQILLFGESDELKSALVYLSLAHNIRCRYTAYIEDEAVNDPDVLETVMSEKYFPPGSSELLRNYPNPFIVTTTLKLQISLKDNNKSKFIELYDIRGRLIRRIDISGLGEGKYEIVMHRSSFGKIENGIILAQLKIDGVLVNTIKMMSSE